MLFGFFYILSQFFSWSLLLTSVSSSLVSCSHSWLFFCSRTNYGPKWMPPFHLHQHNVLMKNEAIPLDTLVINEGTSAGERCVITVSKALFLYVIFQHILLESYDLFMHLELWTILSLVAKFEVVLQHFGMFLLVPLPWSRCHITAQLNALCPLFPNKYLSSLSPVMFPQLFGIICRR